MSNLKEILRQKGYYYSDKCFRNIHIYKNGYEVEQDQFNNIKDSEIQNCKIIISGRYAEIISNGIKFNICDGEYLSIAEGLMRKAFKGNISIRFILNNKVISITEKIKSTLYYIIKIECLFGFKDMKSGLYYEKMDYNATVSDAIQKIPFLIDGATVLPDEITILDENKNPITDKKRQLNTIPDFDKAIFFQISEKSMYTKKQSESLLTSLAKDCYRNGNEVYKYLVSEWLFYTDKCLRTNLYFSINGE